MPTRISKKKHKDKVVQPVSNTDEFKVDIVVDPVEVVAAPEVNPEDLQEPVRPTMTRDEIRDLQLYQALARAADLEVQLESIKRDMWVKQIDPEGRLMQWGVLLRTRGQECAEAKKNHEKTKTSIESRLKLKLSDYAYDDETGELKALDAETEPLAE